MTTENIIRILINEKHYDKVQTERLAPKIDALPTDIRKALECWIETDELSSPEYSGYDVKKILEKRPTMTAASAYLTLDWIRRDANAALKALDKIILARK